MFGAQSMRLLRTKWKSATLLAEELFAMLQDDIPLTQKAPLTLQMPDGSTSPALIIKNPNFSDPFNTTPPIKFIDRNGDTTGSIDKFGDSLDANGNKKAVDVAPKNSVADGSAVYAGVVVSGGPGDTYTVTLLADDGSSLRNVTVKQQSIGPAETIKPGTKTLVGTRGTNYFMQIPVWGDPSP